MDRVPGVTSPLSALEAWAAQTHEAFTALCASGFTEDQALALIAGVTRPRQAGE